MFLFVQNENETCGRPFHPKHEKVHAPMENIYVELVAIGRWFYPLVKGRKPHNIIAQCTHGLLAQRDKI